MKRKIASLFLAGMLAFTGIFSYAEEMQGETTYAVPVKMMQKHEKNKESMANSALKQEAVVISQKDSSKVIIYLKPMELAGAKENINKMFILEGDKKVEAKKSSTGVTPYDVKIEFEVASAKPSEVVVAVWVDAMDKIKGGGEGSGEQSAVLVFDWSKAEVKSVKESDASQDKDKKENPSVDKSDFMAKNGEILVVVGGNLVQFDSAPISKNGRTLVPLRAIFEALQAQVAWDAASQTITAKKDGKTLTLVMNKSEASVSDGSNTTMIKLESPASSVNGRTYVPLRFIGEAFGNKVEFTKQAAGSLIKIS